MQATEKKRNTDNEKVHKKVSPDLSEVSSDLSEVSPPFTADNIVADNIVADNIDHPALLIDAITPHILADAPGELVPSYNPITSQFTPPAPA